MLISEMSFVLFEEGRLFCVCLRGFEEKVSSGVIVLRLIGNDVKLVVYLLGSDK